MTREYRVTWRIEIEADSALEAATLARAIQLDPDSHATVFDVVVDEEAPPVAIDLASDQCPAGGRHVWTDVEEAGTERRGVACDQCGVNRPRQIEWADGYGSEYPWPLMED